MCSRTWQARIDIWIANLILLHECCHLSVHRFDPESRIYWRDYSLYCFAVWQLNLLGLIDGNLIVCSRGFCSIQPFRVDIVWNIRQLSKALSLNRWLITLHMHAHFHTRHEKSSTYFSSTYLSLSITYCDKWPNQSANHLMSGAQWRPLASFPSGRSISCWLHDIHFFIEL